MDTVSQFENVHAQLDARIQSTGHSKWGFVIYRCTYKSDEDWNKMMTKLEEKDAEPYHMAAFNLTQRLRDSLTYAVFEDADLEAGGWYNEYRQHPDIAVGEPWKTEQPSESAGISARYDICIWIDETSLKSILNEPENYVAPEPGTWTKEEEDLVGWVYALRYYKKPLPGAEREWMRITFSDLMTRWYILLRTDGWHHEYRQHPDIAVG
ncbi:hypothetical protein KVT40_008978 [Elsinoe batatas]|uniref:Uncharacterized protein n=1 Tax=Elsinoe batatas TaxID=2601811 RepID=A0A8K0PCX2_9PEZI|nr:hypothetical protein KVT40_008978 [Elsinoe batatas]